MIEDRIDAHLKRWEDGQKDWLDEIEELANDKRVDVKFSGKTVARMARVIRKLVGFMANLPDCYEKLFDALSDDAKELLDVA